MVTSTANPDLEMAAASKSKIPFHKSDLSWQERYAMGKDLRNVCPRKSHAAWKVSATRPDTIDLIRIADKDRIPELLPYRHGRMARSAFTFYRAGALNMAMDLGETAVSGIRVQCCGDAHLCNFGGFATPERQVIFSINDLDETLPAPWEWDVKRLAVSFVVACRDNGLSESTAIESVLTCVRSYRERMEEFSKMKTLERWYFAMYTDLLIAELTDTGIRRKVNKRIVKERGATLAENVYPKLVDSAGGMEFIKDQPPMIFHWKDHAPGQVANFMKDAYVRYQESLLPAYRELLDFYKLQDAAVKAGGVASIGTACWILFLTAGDKDPLFLQFKEARNSVLERFAGKSLASNNGVRIVNGHRLMQPYSDILLGCTSGGMEPRQYFVRQLRDMKISAKVEAFKRTEMNVYAAWCGWALALSHARTGDSAMISGYLGKSDTFDKAIAAFSILYADQNEKDYDRLKKAIHNGHIKAVG